MKFKNLLNFSNPARYIGGEFGIVDVEKKKNVKLKVALCFPDTYEIGMSNNAIKILYDLLNKCDDIIAERVFIPYPDYSDYLLKNKIPLTSLESQTPIKDFDILSITVSSELSYTSILKLLELSNIPIYNKDRVEDYPVVIAGGPAITNPIPMKDFLDFICIGEFEPLLDFFKNEVSNFKNRDDLKNIFKNNRYYWTKGKKKAIRATDTKFVSSNFKYFPIPSIRTTQDHGAVEIMRGCPNGCRFCHAGIFYKPQREKDLNEIISEIDFLVFNCGYRDISLTSLSSGDYSKIEELVDLIYDRYKDYNISFSLPSIKINSFTLSLLEKIANVKKSGLTLAIETACSESQLSVNKNIDFEKLFNIIDSAKKLGWRIIKLYFMIGLPYYIDNPDEEKNSLIDTIENIYNYSKLNINVNIGTFIPKPHTPFQYSSQLDFKKAQNILTEIKSFFEKNNKIKISYHSPFISYIESFLTNGNEKIGKVVYDAYKNGCYLDAWSEYFNIESWRNTINKYKTEIDECIATKFKMPWSSVNLLTSNKYLETEFKRSKDLVLTEKCNENCNHLCGVCNNFTSVKLAKSNLEKINPLNVDYNIEYKYVVLKIKKIGTASLISQRNLIPLVERIFFRANVSIKFSEGFNKKPKMDFANPISIGVESIAEYLMVAVDKNLSKNEILKRLNSATVSGLEWIDIVFLDIKKGNKIYSLMAQYSSSDFIIQNPNILIEENELLKIKKSNKNGVYINISKISITKAIPMLDLIESNITRVETYFDCKGEEKTFLSFNDLNK